MTAHGHKETFEVIGFKLQVKKRYIDVGRCMDSTYLNKLVGFIVQPKTKESPYNE